MTPIYSHQVTPGMKVYDTSSAINTILLECVDVDPSTNTIWFKVVDGGPYNVNSDRYLSSIHPELGEPLIRFSRHVNTLWYLK